MSRALILAPLLALAACGGQPEGATPPGELPDNVTATTEVIPNGESSTLANATADAGAAVPGPDWIGRWTGPEGLFLTIADGGEPGTFDMVVKGDLDSQGDRVEGRAEGDAIVFTRAGTTERLRRTDGEGTGLKWLAGKHDCLVVKPGEGFCRD